MNPDGERSRPDPPDEEFFKLTQEFEQSWGAMNVIAVKLRLIEDRIACMQRSDNARRKITSAEHRLAFSLNKFDSAKRDENEQLDSFLCGVDRPIPIVTVKNALDDVDGKPIASPASNPGGLEMDCINMGRDRLGSVLSARMANT